MAVGADPSKYFEKMLDMMYMQNCGLVTSPKLDMTTDHGDEEAHEKLELHFSSSKTKKTRSAISGSLDVQAFAKSRFKELTLVSKRSPASWAPKIWWYLCRKAARRLRQDRRLYWWQIGAANIVTEFSIDCFFFVWELRITLQQLHKKSARFVLWRVRDYDNMCQRAKEANQLQCTVE